MEADWGQNVNRHHNLANGSRARPAPPGAGSAAEKSLIWTSRDSLRPESDIKGCIGPVKNQTWSNESPLLFPATESTWRKEVFL
ncbi:Hypothetical predicted protein [Marmota monax]|uniref:Uncharacterized protein n=1 Tax=Marmota monax TaxID=9995 RepID=A0A5E4ATM6_MARMO|nr:Hypothetical predicted protein [Marmota monax]